MEDYPTFEAEGITIDREAGLAYKTNTSTLVSELREIPFWWMHY